MGRGIEGRWDGRVEADLKSNGSNKTRPALPLLASDSDTNETRIANYADEVRSKYFEKRKTPPRVGRNGAEMDILGMSQLGRGKAKQMWDGSTGGVKSCSRCWFYQIDLAQPRKMLMPINFLLPTHLDFVGRPTGRGWFVSEMLLGAGNAIESIISLDVLPFLDLTLLGHSVIVLSLLKDERWSYAAGWWLSLSS